VKSLLLPLVLGAWVFLMGIVTFYALEHLLHGVADYDRGAWEGAAVVVVVQGCLKIAQRVMHRKAKQP